MKIGLSKIEQRKEAEKAKNKGRERRNLEQEHISSIYDTENHNMMEGMEN